jgi:hypothetical protein
MWSVLANKDVRFVRHTKKIVIIAHHFLIGSDQHYGQIVRLILFKLVKLKHRLYVVQVDEFVNDAIRIAGNVYQCRTIRWHLVQAMDGHDREQLIDCPVIGY